MSQRGNFPKPSARIRTIRRWAERQNRKAGEEIYKIGELK